jgi:hypothetical protein
VANVTILRSGKNMLAKQAQYLLGSGAGPSAGAQAPQMRRDRKGRQIVEY